MQGRLPVVGAAAELDIATYPGISEADAEHQRELDGPNELPADRSRGLADIALEVVREPMFLMLVLAGGLYLLTGAPLDALMLLGFVAVVMAITVTQERRTEHALGALRDLSSPRARVIRGGKEKRIPGRDVVRGDVVLLSEGDRVPADAILRRSINLSVDESLLTGESVPVRKLASLTAPGLETPGGEDLSSVFSGTLVTAGQGLAEVIQTGARTEIGRIGGALKQIEPEPTPLQRETKGLVRTLALLGLSACVLTVVGYGLTRGPGWGAWKDATLAGIALAMAILPEEFPVVLTVFLAIGAWRISRKRVLTRRMPAVETLGEASVLCVDKTGTLTLNQMTLRRLVTHGCSLELDGEDPELPEELHQLLEYAILASKRDAFDPMERALHAAGDKWLRRTEHLHPEWSMVREYPLSPMLLAVSQAWRRGTESSVYIASKGAPEAIADLCHLPPQRREALAAEAAHLASRGLRVLAVARGLDQGALPDEHHAIEFELLGLIGLEDPIRPTVRAAVAECQSAGIRVIMVTGDYPATAQSIARQAGLPNYKAVISGPELEGMSDDELADRIRTVQVFARVVPEQKLRLVKALKANNEVVAMTGDGVNDAPALRAAHIGVAMGGRGTDVARESASLVLLDDDFSSIVSAVRLGRRIFDNIRKAMSFVLAAHVPIAGLSMIPVFFPDWPMLLLPVHIVFLELVIDPSCSLVFEAEEAEDDVMRRPPRRAADRLFSTGTVLLSVLQGVTALAACLTVFLLSRSSHTAAAARALTFATLVVSLLVIILANRSWAHTILAGLRAPNAALWWVVGGTSALLSLVITLPIGQRLFHFAPLSARDIGLSVLAGVVCITWFELLKLTGRLGPLRDRGIPTGHARWSA